jgi:hypothetical protein
VYDATTAATVTISLVGVFSGDTVTGAASGTFDTKNVGTDKTVMIGSVALSGADSGNYAVGSAGTATADITPAALTASGTAADKVYDATTAATVTISLVGVFSGDTVTGAASGTFDTKNVGTDKTVTIGTVALSGADSGNYAVGSAGTATADITAKALTVTADAQSKLVGTADPALTYVALGFVGGETAATALTGGLTRDPGEAVGAYAIRQGTLTAIAGNYAIAFTGSTLEIRDSDADTTAPTVTIDQAADQADPATTLPIRFTVVFNEPVTGFGAEDVVLFGTAPGVLTVEVTGSGTTYTVAVSGMTGNGTVRARVAACAAMDAAGNQSVASTSTDNTIHVQVTAAEITGNADTYETDEDVQLIVPAPGVLVNDEHPENEPLTAELLTTTSFGQLAFNPATGAFSYRPFDNYFGGDKFVYRAVSGGAVSEAVTVTITVKPMNDPPVARDDMYSVVQGETLTISAAGGLLANDTDVDSVLTVRNVSVVSGGGTLDVQADGSFTYNPGGFTGTARFEYEAWDELTYSTAKITIEVTAPQATPVVESVVINDGAAQRSMVNSLTVTFASVVPLAASHFRLINKDTGAEVGLVFAASDATGKSVVTLTFTGAGIVGSSLADGNYLLIIDLKQDGFDTVDDYQFGADEADKFFRFFGDSDGDRDVDSLDYLRIRGVLNQPAKYLWHFDYDLDADVDSGDMAQFQARYGKKLAWTA